MVLFMALITLLTGLCERGLSQHPPDPYRPGPWVFASKGKIWPKPQMQTYYETLFTVDPHSFQFKLTDQSSSCAILKKAMPRITNRLFPEKTLRKRTRSDPFLINDVNYGGELNTVEVTLSKPIECEDSSPNENMDEEYEIKVDSPDARGRAQIISYSPWGLLKGMSSFTHLVYEHKRGQQFVLNGTLVMDFPRFPFRGFMLDTSRHFLPKKVILDVIDLMEMNKFNVFHWHLTDDPSFPFESVVYPELSLKGAFSQNHVYSHADIKEIIEEARIRGIRVIPEFDSPGHTMSIAPSRPDLLTKCGTAGDMASSINLPAFGPLNPINDEVYLFVKNIYKEITSLFSDTFLHLGGDEVDKSCWASNKEILDYMKLHNMTGQYNKLESLYVERLLKILKYVGRGEKIPIVWQEVFDNHDDISSKTIVDVWKGGWVNTTMEVTKAGHQAIISAPFYLSSIRYGIDWPTYYNVDLTAFGGTTRQQMLVKGGKVCIWGEYINQFNVISIGWPRSSIVAERLWSAKNVMDVKDAAERLQEHACRMTKSGYPVGPPSGPSFCPL